MVLAEILVSDGDPASGGYRVLDWTERVDPSLSPRGFTPRPPAVASAIGPDNELDPNRHQGESVSLVDIRPDAKGRQFITQLFSGS